MQVDVISLYSELLYTKAAFNIIVLIGDMMKSTMLAKLLLVSAVVVSVQAEHEAVQTEELTQCVTEDVSENQSGSVAAPAGICASDIKNLSVVLRIKRLDSCTDTQWEQVKAVAVEFDTQLNNRDTKSQDERSTALQGILVQLIEMNAAEHVLSGEISISLEQPAVRDSKLGLDIAQKAESQILRDYMIADTMFEQQDWMQIRDAAIELLQDPKNVVPANIAAFLVRLTDAREGAAKANFEIVQDNQVERESVN